jgi:hypothetical protein
MFKMRLGIYWNSEAERINIKGNIQATTHILSRKAIMIVSA